MQYLIKFCYDGTNYRGYGTQPHGNTIQDNLEKVLKKIFKTKIKTTACSRTDAKVHARVQYAIFDTPFSIESEKLQKALNTLLPKDIHAIGVKINEKNFHPRYDCISKSYEYIINTKKDVFKENYSYYYPSKLDIVAMKEASKFFLGTHDFKSCSTHKEGVSSTERTIYKIDIDEVGSNIIIKICGNGFLYNMVRIMVGNLLAVGERKINPEQIEEILNSKERKNSFLTVPPQGLYLTEINYKE